MGLDRALIIKTYNEERVKRESGAIKRAVHRLNKEGTTITYGTARRIIREGTEPAIRRTRSRFAPRQIDNRAAKLPAITTTALTEKRTIYPHTVVGGVGPLLKSGFNSSKIGAQILKGKWKGMPVYTLTLEERATCPTECRHWRSCFGNKMQFAQRHDHTHPDFELTLAAEVEDLGWKHPNGFVIRLHVLGDFYSVRYVQLWRCLIESVPGLRVFGYTARIDGRRDPIAVELVKLTQDHWDRFAMRFSNAPIDECSTVSIEHPIQAPSWAFICPEQTGKTESCSTCGACWGTKKPVCFLQH